MKVEGWLTPRTWLSRLSLALLLSGTGCGSEAPNAPTQEASLTTALARPNFQAPFPCGQSWTYSHHSAEVRRALDFVKNGGGTDGQPQLASAAGYATRHVQSSGAGNYIKIDHGGGWVTYYFHLSAFSVPNGTQVAQGQQIGLTGSTGASTGPHVHYEQLLNGVGQDIVLNGVSLAPYPSSYGSKSIISNNCGQPPPEDPALLKPATVSKLPGQLNTFIRGADGAIWDKWWTGSQWVEWQSLGGNHKYGPAAVSVAADRVDVYSVGTDNALWQKHWNGTQWSNWESRGGTFTSGPAAVSLSPGTVHLYARGADNALWQKWWNGTQWSNWESLGGTLTSGPAAVSLSPGTVHVYARGTDNAIHQKHFNGTVWSNWESLGGNLTSGPGAVSMSSGTVHLFARGGDNAIWQKSFNGTVWSNWETLGGTFTSGPSAGSLSPGTLHVQARGTDNSVWQKSWSGTEWSAWQNLGGSMQ